MALEVRSDCLPERASSILVISSSVSQYLKTSTRHTAFSTNGLREKAMFPGWVHKLYGSPETPMSREGLDRGHCQMPRRVGREEIPPHIAGAELGKGIEEM